MTRISGPLLDRIDLHVEVTPVKLDDLASARNSEDSRSIRQRVVEARQLQAERFREEGIYCNAQMSTRLTQEVCALDAASQSLLNNAMKRLGLSARAYERIIRVARTIADLSKSAGIRSEHIAEAIQFRSLDRETWVVQ